ncbi:hypothetical protein CMI47_09995 [Candidatus Pacearchaeota archaeon]|jgi:hypothetical protein|nr:hypothetical protein [Candidatus Pacearchaeota archaeon]|tara:strand:- start:8679 stop:8888 length:210 start_codon:yes stop_codon:yes gene_type:complete
MIINEEVIVERKETLLSDLEIVRLRLLEYDKKKIEDQSLFNALQGAIQQCDDFLNRLNDDKGDEENSES